MKKRRKKLIEKGISIQNEVTNKILPQTVNQIILLGSSFIVVLTTLSNPQSKEIYLYRSLLCVLLLSILCGVICISTLTIDYYNLGKKIQNKAKEENSLDNDQIEFHTGKIYYKLILWTFVTCLASFLVSVVLIMIYAWY
jgi:magnesium-transporting ATPase (P-type)